MNIKFLGTSCHDQCPIILVLNLIEKVMMMGISLGMFFCEVPTGEVMSNLQFKIIF